MLSRVDSPGKRQAHGTGSNCMCPLYSVRPHVVTSHRDFSCASMGTGAQCTRTISETQAMHNSERLRNEQVGQVVAEIMRLVQQREDLELQTLHRTQVE